MSKPLVSIITPCYNMAHCVFRLFDSILIQDYRPLEFILVNDGSTDHIEELVQQYRPKFEEAGIAFSYVPQENKGLGGAINAGLKHMTGDYFVWPDADDYLEPDSISARVQVLENQPDCAVVTGQAYVRDCTNLEHYKSILSENNQDSDRKLQFELMLDAKALFCSGCHMVRTSYFEAVNPNRAIYPARRGQNWQLLLPLYFSYKRAFLNKPVYNVLNFPNSMSKNEQTLESNLFRFSEHETILHETLKMIERVQNVDLHPYFSFLEDKYAKLRIQAAIQYKSGELVKDEIVKKQRSVGLDFQDYIQLIRAQHPSLDVLIRPLFRLFKGYWPDLIPEKQAYKLKNIDFENMASGDMPLVSVLIPVYNGTKYIDQCFSCLLAQSYRNLQIIVVNDGSTDETEDILCRYESIFNEAGFEYIHLKQPNGRLAVAMNNALQYVSGKYFLVYEIDDILFRDGIWEKVVALESHQDYGMVVNNGYYINSFDEWGKNLFVNQKNRRNMTTLFDDILFERANNWGASYMIRTDLFFNQVGDAHKIYEHPGGAHLQFMLPMAYSSNVFYVDKPLMALYVHIDSDSHKGGIEASIKRSNWYEEIRCEVVRQISMSENKKNTYINKIHRMYDIGRLKLAIAVKDKQLYNENIARLNYSKIRAEAQWRVNINCLNKPVRFIKKVVCFFERTVLNLRCNLRFLKRNSKSYSA